VHLDFSTDDVEAEVARLVELGATETGRNSFSDFGWVVLADSDGNAKFLRSRDFARARLGVLTAVSTFACSAVLCHVDSCRLVERFRRSRALFASSIPGSSTENMLFKAINWVRSPTTSRDLWVGLCLG
jgi:Glyoxalase-like domain